MFQLLVRKFDQNAVVEGQAPALVTKEEQRVVFGAVYIPEVVDVQGDWMREETIRKSAYEFVQRGDMRAIDVMHNNQRCGAFIVESFLARKGDPDFVVPGTWVLGVHLPSPTCDGLWDDVKKGKLNGFSLEAIVQNTRPLEAPVRKSALSFPGKLIGRTQQYEGHEHSFEAIFDASGKVVGGRTNVVKDENGVPHHHEILRHTHTEDAGLQGHRHRFAALDHFLEGMS